MKKIASSIIVIALFSLGCSDKENPVVELGSRYLENVYGPVPEFELLADPKKNVLVEYYTGHKCGFCPPATAQLKAMDTEFGERLVPVAIHAGSLAAVGEAPFDRNFTTPEGDEYWLQLEARFNPGARFDRTPVASELHGQAFWNNLFNQQLSEQPKAVLQVVTSYVPEDEVLNIHVHSQFLQNDSRSYSLVVLITESQIVSPQVDYNLSPPEILDYQQYYVLHDVLTPTNGVPLVSNPRINDVFVRSYSYELNPDWDPDHCTVVAYIVDNETLAVINAIEKDAVE